MAGKTKQQAQQEVYANSFHRVNTDPTEAESYRKGLTEQFPSGRSYAFPEAEAALNFAQQMRKVAAAPAAKKFVGKPAAAPAPAATKPRGFAQLFGLFAGKTTNIPTKKSNNVPKRKFK
jgi:hypothetical protein